MVDLTFPSRGTERLEAFSDSVFAFAMTLLVLNLYDPTLRGQVLIPGLLNEWTSFLALVTSFITILVMWINHHNMFTYISRVSREVMILNGLLLLFIVLIPFTTLLVSEHLRSSDETVATAVYAGDLFLLSLIWTLFWHNASHHHNLIDTRVPPDRIKQITREYRVAPVFYGFALVLAFIIPFASVTLIIATAIYYAVTVTGGEQV